MNKKRQDRYNSKMKYEDIQNLIFGMKDDKLKDNLFFLMDSKLKKKEKNRVKELMGTNFINIKGRDWLDYLLNNISFDKFNEKEIVKKFIEYYKKYNLSLKDNKIIGIETKENPVNKDPSYMIKQWKMFFNQNEVEQKYEEESKEFMKYHNNNAL